MAEQYSKSKSTNDATMDTTTTTTTTLPHKPHALIVPYPTQGHINPAFQFAKHLAHQGFLITFLHSEYNYLRISHSQQTHPITPLHPHIRLVSIPDGLPPHYDRMADFSALSNAIEQNMAPAFHELLKDLTTNAQPHVSCIFSDVLMLFTQDAANKFGVPRIVFWLQSAASYAVNLHVPTLIQEGHMPFKAHPDNHHHKEDKVITCIPGHPPLRPTDLPSLFQVEDLSDFMLQFKIRPFQRMHEAKFVLINSFKELEAPMVDTLRHQNPAVITVGPLLAPAFFGIEDFKDNKIGSDLWPEDDKCLDWLNKQRKSSVLYISFGSIALLSPPQFRELFLGLEASQQPLLWTIRPDLMDSVAPALPAHFWDSKQERVYRTSWAPQQLVLSHPAVGGFLTHCGWNSTLESISMGVPMLGWPCFAEQMLNRMWIVEEWKVGSQFEAGEDGMVRKEEVERVVRLVMEGEEGREMRERVRRLRDEAYQSVRKGGSSYENLEMVVQMLKQS